MAQLVEHNLAKVGVAGSNPVVRSKRITRSEHWEGSKSAPLGASEMAFVPHLHHISSEFLGDRTVDPDILHVWVTESATCPDTQVGEAHWITPSAEGLSDGWLCGHCSIPVTCTLAM